jgi:hypothetical protein
MVGYGAAFRASSASAFLGGVAGALVAAGVLLFGAVGLVYLAIVLVMPLAAIGALAVGMLAAAIVYGIRLARIRRAVPRDGAWAWGLIVGAIGVVCLPVLAQNIHERQFQRRLAGLAAADADTRSQALRSLQGSRFCWAGCVRAVCNARDKLDASIVATVLGTDDVETACDDPGMSEWPG